MFIVVWEVKFHKTNSDHLFTCSEDGAVWHWDSSLVGASHMVQTQITGTGKYWLSGVTATSGCCWRKNLHIFIGDRNVLYTCSLKRFVSENGKRKKVINVKNVKFLVFCRCGIRWRQFLHEPLVPVWGE